MSHHPALTKKFVSPFLQRPTGDGSSSRAGPSTSTSYNTPTRPAVLPGAKKRKIKDYISDSAGEDDDDDDVHRSGPSSSARPDATPNDYPDPVARVVGSAGPLGRGSPYARPSASSSSLAGGLIPRDGTIRGALPGQEKENVPETYWMVQWRKPQAKKHKTWDGDAVLIVRGARCYMKDTDGRDIASAAFTGGTLREGDELRVGGKEIEIDCEIPAQNYLDGSCFGHNPLPLTGPTVITSRPINLKPLPQSLQSPYAASAQQRAAEAAARSGTAHAQGRTPIAAGSFYASKGEKVALGVGNQGTRKGVIEPRYNPNAEGAVVMKRPSKDHAAKHNKKNLEIVDVVVHPELGKCLRPHQVEGVKFMYECVMGMRKTEGTGCILADEMGLGKTLQAISLIFTLLQQNPYGGPGAGPVVGKVLVVTPVSLVQNWRKEFHKWLGKQRVGVFVGDGDKQKIRQFANSKGHQVLLIGYEKLRTVVDVIKSCVPPIGLIICDEAHRLKSKDNKTTKMFDALSTKRRILLSGTPLQNDLGEFWAMSDFACPGLLDTYSVFSKIYEKPILKSRAPKCSVKDKELGQARADKLSEITGQFILRRTADILAHYLPPKREYIVFIAPTSLQLEIFAALLTPKVLQAFTRGATAQCLALINHLKKICNCPQLLKAKEESLEGVDDEMRTAMRLIPQGKHDPIPMSGKLTVLDNLLSALHRNTDEKIVLVSNYTSTLDVLESYCSRKHYRTLRLDGSTAVKTRQDLVDAFNNGDQRQSFVFLLSSKAGGVGLNLIGASRLVLFDSDWNPSTDLQAQARIHRDGQKRVVHIYRFLTTGTIEEKIYQRQITKLGLSDQLMDQAKSSKNKETDSFSPEELRDLFTVQLKTDGCQTHDLLGCDCTEKQTADAEEGDLLGPDSDASGDEGPRFVVATQYDGRPSKKQRVQDAEAKQAKLAALLKFTHIDPSVPAAAALIQDDILHGLLGIGKRKKAVAPTSVTSGEVSRAPSEIADSADEEDVDMQDAASDAPAERDDISDGIPDSASESESKEDAYESVGPGPVEDDADDDLLLMFADTVEASQKEEREIKGTEDQSPIAAAEGSDSASDDDSEQSIPWDASPKSPGEDLLQQMMQSYEANDAKEDTDGALPDIGLSDEEDADMSVDREAAGIAEFDAYANAPKGKRKAKGKAKSAGSSKRTADSSRSAGAAAGDDAVEEPNLLRKSKGKAKSKIKVTDEDEEEVDSADKHNAQPKKKGKSKTNVAITLGPTEKKYDLQAIADRGEGGKIMFVFEKVSGSVM